MVVSSLFGVFLVIVVVGVALWLVTTYVPMAQPVKGILTAVVVLVLLFWILSVFGFLPAFATAPVRVR